jgi:hypothetical protein
MRLVLTRDIFVMDCPWLDRAFEKGDLVWAYHGCTYGCVSDGGRAVTLHDGQLPFFELPRDALAPVRPELAYSVR